MDLKILMVHNAPVNIRIGSHGLMTSKISFTHLGNFGVFPGVEPLCRKELGIECEPLRLLQLLVK